METYTGAYSRKSRMSTPQDPEAPPQVYTPDALILVLRKTHPRMQPGGGYTQGYSAYTHHNYMVLDCKRIQTMQKHITNNKKIIVIHNHTDLHIHLYMFIIYLNEFYLMSLCDLFHTQKYIASIISMSSFLTAA